MLNSLFLYIHSISFSNILIIRFFLNTGIPPCTVQDEKIASNALTVAFFSLTAYLVSDKMLGASMIISIWIIRSFGD